MEQSDVVAAGFQFSRSELQIDFRPGHRSEPVMNKKESHERPAILSHPPPETIGVCDYPLLQNVHGNKGNRLASRYS